MFAVVNGIADTDYLGIPYRLRHTQKFLVASLLRTGTPVHSNACHGTATVALLLDALWFPIESLAKATSVLLLIVFARVNLSLWRLKRCVANGERTAFRVPCRVPASGFFASSVCVVLQAVLEAGG